MESKETKTGSTKFEKGVKIAELLLKFLGLFLAASVLVVVCINAQFGNITNNYQEEISLEKRLIEAQNYYLDGYYIKAYEIYEECHNTSAIASINLGYLYSKGLGCKADFSLACRYYKQAYEYGLKEGLANYLAINLMSPNSFEETLSALAYGFEYDDETAIYYLSYFETGTMYGQLYDFCRQNAEKFLAKATYKQVETLKDKLVLRNAEMIRLESAEVPEDTDFKTYAKYDDFVEHIGNKTISIPVEENGSQVWVLKDVDAYKTSSYYIISHMRFNFADYFVAENYYKI